MSYSLLVCSRIRFNPLSVAMRRKAVRTFFFFRRKTKAGLRKRNLVFVGKRPSEKNTDNFQSVDSTIYPFCPEENCWGIRKFDKRESQRTNPQYVQHMRRLWRVSRAFAVSTQQTNAYICNVYAKNKTNENIAAKPDGYYCHIAVFPVAATLV